MVCGFPSHEEVGPESSSQNSLLLMVVPNLYSAESPTKSPLPLLDSSPNFHLPGI
jgi:hypothetical protein